MRHAPGKTIGLFALCLAAWAGLALRFDFVCDDAYISFRYARHLAEGHGLVYNLGREVPVEGYSNFLWVVLLAPFEAAGLDLPDVSRALSALCGAALVALALLHARRRLGLDRAETAAAGLLLATLPPIALYTTSGLATMPLALALFGAFALLLGDPARPRGLAAGLVALSAALLRADGVGYVGLLWLAAVLVWARRGRPRALGRALGLVAAIVLVGVALHVLWRLESYGALVPNTARVKAGFSSWRLVRGGFYVATFALVLPGATLAGLWAATRALRGRVPLEVAAPALSLLGGAAGYAVWVGGDFMPFGRFLVPALPFLVPLVGAALRGLRAPGAAPRRRRIALALTLAAALQGGLAAFDRNPVPESVRRLPHFRADRPWQSEVERWRDMRKNTAAWELWGRALARYTRPGESIVLGGIGAVGYRTELFIYDTYGLVTPEVLEHAEIRPRASPGHDVRVSSLEVFLPLRPTYLGAGVVPERPLAPGEALPEWALASREQALAAARRPPLAQIARIEEHPLDPSEGFPPGSVLLLLRNRDAE